MSIVKSTVFFVKSICPLFQLQLTILVRLFTLRRKVSTSIITCSIDECADSGMPPRNCNDRNINYYIDRNTLISKRIQEKRSKTPLPHADNDYQDTSTFNESHKNSYNGIVLPGFPDNTIKHVFMAMTRTARFSVGCV